MMSEPNLKCSYPTPCIGMDNHALPNDSRKGGIHALDNRVVLTDPSQRMFHMGFALRPSPHPNAGKAGVMLNFCPWCGGDLMAWLEAFRADIAAHKASLAAAPPVTDRTPADCCRACEAKHRPAPLARRFIVCPTCGNKRCPKATHHDNQCTGSNEPGQPGSEYT